MNFKHWLEHYGGLYPEEGDFVFIKNLVRDYTTLPMPTGRYFVLKTDGDKYTIKKVGTGDIYFMFVDDMDDYIKNGDIQAEN
jgi:hypothetical protein